MGGSKRNFGFEALKCEDKRGSYLGLGNEFRCFRSEPFDSGKGHRVKGYNLSIFRLAQALDPVMTPSSKHGNWNTQKRTRRLRAVKGDWIRTPRAGKETGHIVQRKGSG